MLVLSLILFLNSYFVHGQGEMNKIDSFLEAKDEKLRENLPESTKFYSIQHSESGTISEISSTTRSL